MADIPAQKSFATVGSRAGRARVLEGASAEYSTTLGAMITLGTWRGEHGWLAPDGTWTPGAAPP